MKKYIISAFALAFVIGLAGNAHAAANLSGWAYSNGIGWISLSSITPNSGGCGGGTCSYGVTISTTTSPTVGTFDGYGWSSNVGWISFKQADVSQCGSQAQVDLSTGNPTSGAVTGWARVISGSADSGWDGCVKLSDPVKFASPNNNNTLFPGVTTDGGITFGVDPTKSNYRKFGGFSWGDMNVGWMIFNMVLCPDCIGGINQNTLSATCSSNPSPANLSNTGGSVTFNANAQGGTPPYKYYWDGDTITQGQAISKVKNYGAGNNTYNELLQVSDSGGSTPVNPICPQVTVGTGGNGANNGQCGSYVYTDRTCGAGTWTDGTPDASNYHWTCVGSDSAASCSSAIVVNTNSGNLKLMIGLTKASLPGPNDTNGFNDSLSNDPTKTLRIGVGKKFQLKWNVDSSVYKSCTRDYNNGSGWAWSGTTSTNSGSNTAVDPGNNLVGKYVFTLSCNKIVNDPNPDTSSATLYLTTSGVEEI